MSEKFTIEYEAEGILFEFTPTNGTKGDLCAAVAEKAFLSKLDLTAAKGRGAFVQECYELYPDEFTLDEVAFRRALNDLATHVDEQLKIRAAKAEEEEADEEDDDGNLEPPPDPGTEEYEAAMRLLTSKDVLAQAAKAMRRLGHVGETRNKKLALISAVSARAGLPVQPSTHAQSSAGKNYLWDTVLALVPPELVHKRTGFSAKALFRTQMSLKHSVLYIQELAGSDGADFSIRTLQSDNVLKWEATEKQADGTLANVEYEVEGPTVIIQTTTKNHLHPENETRVVPIYLDESSEQTGKITREVLRHAAGRGSVSEAVREKQCAVWHDAIRLLEPAEVVIPYAERINVPNHIVRIRRDVPRLINIIKLVAWFHQHTREKDDQGQILATEEDFHTAIGIVGESFSRAWKSLTPTEEKIYSAITEHISENLRRQGFKRKHVEGVFEKTGEHVPPPSMKEALRTLASSGFLETDGKRGATGATYTVAKSKGVTGSITLGEKKQNDTPSIHSSIKPKSGESGVGKGNRMDGSESIHSHPLSINEDERMNGWKRMDNDPSIKKGVDKPKSADFEGNGRMAEESAENKKGADLEYEYSEDE